MADNLLSGNVTIPHVGKFPKWAVVGGVGGVIGLIIWEKHKQAQAPGAAAAVGDPFPADGTVGNPNDPYSLDPSTGVTYGDEAASGLGAGYGGYSPGIAGGGGGGFGISAVTDTYPWDGTYSNPNDPYSMDPATGQTYGDEGATGTSQGITTGQAGPPFTTNAQWSQYVLQYFTDNQFADLPGMTDAIGKYLAGQPVTALQQGYINDAIAIAGRPPVSGPGNFPPSIRVTGSTASPTGPTSGSAPGSMSGGKPATPSVSNGHIVSNYNNGVTVAWTPHGPATSWRTTLHFPGSEDGRTNTVHKPEAVYSGLPSGHTGWVIVQPLVNGKPAGKAGRIDIRTTKGK